MIQLGTTLRCNLPPRHIWVVLSDPRRTHGEILIANMTSLRPDSVDTECILDLEDYPLLTHSTTVAYSRHQIGRAERLEALTESGDFSVITTVSEQTLKKILEGARNSPQIPQAQKKLLG